MEIKKSLKWFLEQLDGSVIAEKNTFRSIKYKNETYFQNCATHVIFIYNVQLGHLQNWIPCTKTKCAKLNVIEL